MIENDAPGGTTRRVMLQAGAWSIPAVVAVSASPAYASSGTTLPAGLTIGPLVGSHGPSAAEIETYGPSAPPDPVQSQTWISGLGVSYQPLARSTEPITVTLTLQFPDDWFAGERTPVIPMLLRRSTAWVGPHLFPVAGPGLSANHLPEVDGVDSTSITLIEGNALSLTVTLQPGESTDPLAVLELRDVKPDRARSAGLVANAGNGQNTAAVPFLTVTEQEGDVLGPDPRLSALDVEMELYVGPSEDDVDQAMAIAETHLRALLEQDQVPPEQIDPILQGILPNIRASFLSAVVGPDQQQVKASLGVLLPPDTVTGMQPRTVSLAAQLDLPATWTAQAWQYRDALTPPPDQSVMNAEDSLADTGPTWRPLPSTPLRLVADWTTEENTGAEAVEVRRGSIDLLGPVLTSLDAAPVTLTVQIAGTAPVAVAGRSTTVWFLDEVRAQFPPLSPAAASRARTRTSLPSAEAVQQAVDTALRR